MKYILFGLFFFASLFSSADESPLGYQRGNGGKGVQKNGQIILLDLFERGLDDGSVSFDHKSNSNLAKDVNNALYSKFKNQETVISLVTSKISEIANANYEVAWNIAKSLNKMDFTFQPGELPVSSDADDLCRDNTTCLQLAFRTDQHVALSQKYWLQLSEPQRAALILHEIIYFSYDPKSKKTESENHLIRNFIAESLNIKRNLKNYFWDYQVFQQEIFGINDSDSTDQNN